LFLSADSHFIPGKEIELSENVHLRRLLVACRVQAWQALEVLGEMRAEGEEEILVQLASSLQIHSSTKQQMKPLCSTSTLELLNTEQNYSIQKPGAGLFHSITF
jgi:hypothetical protein